MRHAFLNKVFAAFYFCTTTCDFIFSFARPNRAGGFWGAGMFDWDDTIRTANILGFLALAMISDSLLPLTARTFMLFTILKLRQSRPLFQL